MNDSTVSYDDVVSAVDELCETAVRLTVGTDLEAQARAILDRLRGPLRIAIAGRLKAGKSTLLNALVGERLAATDAGECTKVISVFSHAPGYEVAAVLTSGGRKPLSFNRTSGSVSVDLAGLAHDEIERLEIGWPARSLGDISLIDTPGLESLNEENSRRTQAFLEHDATNPASADAVIYLMRHLHKSDADFLGAFMDRSVAGASPVNAVAVLSRADEIGASRPDAMASSTRIANRYAADPTVRTLVASVVPVAGLLAETGLTLVEQEYQALGALAAMPKPERQLLCLSVDDFCDVAQSPLTAEIRRDLLDRLGLFGVRRAIHAIAQQEVQGAGELSAFLVDLSGLRSLRDLIDSHFLPRSQLLKSRSALVALRGIAADMTQSNAAEASGFATAIDRVDAAALEFSILEAVHLVVSGMVKLGEVETSEVTRVLHHNDPAIALGLSELSAEERQTALLTGIGRWRGKTNDPLSSPLVTTVADAMARMYERVYVASQ